jgi:hypothetical protein
MHGLLNLNLIHFLDFYFSFMFFAGLARRIGQYQNVAKLILSGPTRWPKLLKLIHEHRTIFLTWQTMTPALLALGLTVVQVIASRWIWPEAGTLETGLTLGRLLDHWPVVTVIAPLAAAMLALDLYSLYLVGQIERAMLEKHFDQAEYWLKSKTAEVVRVFTFGFVNPRKMVADEVQKALVATSDMLNFTLWWVTVQTGLRFAFGLSLWLTWALG